MFTQIPWRCLGKCAIKGTDFWKYTLKRIFSQISSHVSMHWHCNFPPNNTHNITARFTSTKIMQLKRKKKKRAEISCLLVHLHGSHAHSCGAYTAATSHRDEKSELGINWNKDIPTHNLWENKGQIHTGLQRKHALVYSLPTKKKQKNTNIS